MWSCFRYCMQESMLEFAAKRDVDTLNFVFNMA